MNLSHALTILIQGKNLAAPALRGAASGVQDLTDKVAASGRILDDLGRKGPIVFRLLGAAISGTLKLVTMLTAAVIALVSAFFSAGIAAAQYAKKLESTSRAFQGILQNDAPAMLKALRENSSFMLSDLRIQEQYVSAYMLTGEVLAKRMPEAYQYLGKVALATHDDLDFLTERLYRSVGRLSTRWMAYIGTVVELEEAQAHAAKMFDTTTDALTREQTQAGMLDRVLQKLAIRTALMPEILGTTEQMTIAVTTSFKNLWGEFGTHFLPILRVGASILLRLIALFDRIISQGGPLYNFFRTFAATISVVGDALNDLLDQFEAVEDQVFDGLEGLADNAMRTAWKAFSWGVSIITNLAAGMIKGAATALTTAINWIAKLLSSWFRPSSPPKVAAEIDKWGTETMNLWLEGFLLADFDILGGVQSQLENVLDAMVAAGMLDTQKAARSFLDISYDMIEALADLQGTGMLTAQMFDRLAEVGGGFGEHLVKLTMLQMDYSKAVDRVTRATLALEKAEVELEDSQKHLLKTTDEYYMLLLTGASYEELVAGRATRNAAQQRRTSAKTNLAAAEIEKKASEEGLEGLEDRLSLQNQLIDQLTLLLQKQAELADDAAKTLKDPKAGGAVDEPFELPELIMPETFGANLDEAFEDLKENIRKKFAELWEGIVEDWEASGAGQALGELQQALIDLRLQVEADGPEIQKRIDAIVDPIRAWIEEEIWNWAVLEWDKWVIWWETDGSLLAGAVKTTLAFIQGDLEDTENAVGALTTAFMILQGFVETVFSLGRGVASIAALMIEGDWGAVGDKFNEVMEEVAQNLFDKTEHPIADEAIANYLRIIENSQPDFIDAGATLGRAVQEGMGNALDSPTTVISFERTGLGLASQWIAVAEEIGGTAGPIFSDVGAGSAAALGRGLETTLSAIPGDRFMLPVVERLTRSSQVWSDVGAVLGRALGSATGKGVKEGAADLDNILTALGGSFVPKLLVPATKSSKSFRTDVFPPMTEAVEIHMGKVLPMYTQESIWLGIHLPKAGKVLKDNQVDDVWPGVTDAVTSTFSRILPRFMQMSIWEGITIPLAGVTLQKAQEKAWAAIFAAVELAWAGDPGILLMFEAMQEWMEVTLPEAIEALSEDFVYEMDLIYESVYKTYEYWGGFVNSVMDFWRWLQNRRFVIDVDVNVPPEGELGSPLKIHTAWMDFEKYLNHTTFSARMDLNSVSGSEKETGATHFYIESLTLQGVQNPRGLLTQLQEMV